MKRRANNDGPPVVFLNKTVNEKRLQSQLNRYSYIHDKVITKLDAVMKYYPQGEFEQYKAAWKESNMSLDDHPSKLKNAGYLANGFSEDRYEAFVEFIYRVIDHIRQSINMLKNYQDASKLREEYEDILRDPERLMQYYREHYKNPSVQRFFNVSEQLGEMPMFNAKIINYIKSTNHSIRPMHQLKNIGSSADGKSSKDVVKYIIREAHKLGIPDTASFAILADDPIKNIEII